jgi:hypothetical protein
MRAGTCGAFLIIAAIATGCATQPTDAASVVLRAVDGAVWLYTEEIDRFRCETGLLTCDDAGGRLSQRRCRCLE